MHHEVVPPWRWQALRNRPNASTSGLAYFSWYSGGFRVGPVRRYRDPRGRGVHRPGRQRLLGRCPGRGSERRHDRAGEPIGTTAYTSSGTRARSRHQAPREEGRHARPSSLHFATRFRSLQVRVEPSFLPSSHAFGRPCVGEIPMGADLLERSPSDFQPGIGRRRNRGPHPVATLELVPLLLSTSARGKAETGPLHLSTTLRRTTGPSPKVGCLLELPARQDPSNERLRASRSGANGTIVVR